MLDYCILFTSFGKDSSKDPSFSLTVFIFSNRIEFTGIHPDGDRKDAPPDYSGTKCCDFSNVLRQVLSGAIDFIT